VCSWPHTSIVLVWAFHSTSGTAHTIRLLCCFWQTKSRMSAGASATAHHDMQEENDETSLARRRRGRAAEQAAVRSPVGGLAGSMTLSPARTTNNLKRAGHVAVATVHTRDAQDPKGAPAPEAVSEPEPEP
jgi:hypothetical protein